MSIQWWNGRLLDPTDSAFAARVNALRAAGSACITTARIRDGHALHQAYHIRRLSRDARMMGLGDVDPKLVIDAFARLGRTAFGDSSGIVRIEARSNPSGEIANLHATARPLGLEPANWTARTAPTVHPGPQRFPGAKLASCGFCDEARAFVARSGVNEALLFDSAGRLVEGSVTNLLIARSDGTLATPDVALGAVAGIALEIVAERVCELTTVALDVDDLVRAEEIIAINAVRGARPIVRFDDKKVGAGAAGPWSKRLNAILASAT